MLGEDPIESLTEQSAAAGQCNIWYNPCRRQTLEDFDWNFARRRATLALHGDAAPSGIWTFRYQVPSDCLSARYIQNPLGDQADPVPFEMELSLDGSTQSILTNAEDAILIYTVDQETTDFFPPYFVDALATNIASRIAFKVTGKRTIMSDMIQLYFVKLARAEAHEGNRRGERKPREASWVEARG